MEGGFSSFFFVFAFCTQLIPGDKSCRMRHKKLPSPPPPTHTHTNYSSASADLLTQEEAPLFLLATLLAPFGPLESGTIVKHFPMCRCHQGREWKEEETLKGEEMTCEEDYKSQINLAASINQKLGLEPNFLLAPAFKCQKIDRFLFFSSLFSVARHVFKGSEWHLKWTTSVESRCDTVGRVFSLA